MSSMSHNSNWQVARAPEEEDGVRDSASAKVVNARYEPTDMSKDPFAYSDTKEVPQEEVEEAEETLWTLIPRALSKSASLPAEEPELQVIEDYDEENSACRGVRVELTEEIVQRLIEALGDKENEVAKAVEVDIPLWIAQYLYFLTTGGQHVPEHMPSSGESSNSNTRKNSGATTKFDEIMESQKAEHDAKVKEMIEFFPELTRQCIDSVVQEYSHDESAIHTKLTELSERGTSEGADKTADSTYIIPSAAPKVIIPKRKGALEEEENPYHRLEGCTDNDAKFFENLYAETMNKFKTTMEKASNKMIGAIYAEMARGYLKEAQGYKLCATDIRLKLSDAIADMHDMTADQAQDALAKRLYDLRHSNLKKLHVITGWGKNNGGKSVIKPRLEKFLRERNIPFTKPAHNKGMLIVTLPK